MVNKKAQQVSINMVVGIIMGLVMLGAGIMLFVQIVDKSESTTLEVEAAIEQRYLGMFSDDELLFRPVKQADYKGKTLEFYYGINNINNDPTDFEVQITSMDLDDGSLDEGDLSRQSIKFLNTEETILPHDKLIRKFLVADAGVLSEGQHLIKITVTEKDTGTEYTNPKIITVNVK